MRDKMSVSWRLSGRRMFLLLLMCGLLSLLMSNGLSAAVNVTPDHRRISSRIVTTKYGALRGSLITLNNRNLQQVEAFMGIPYASPPVGKLRFMPPVTPAHWTGVRSANSAGPVCPQKLPDISNETRSLSSVTSGRLSQLKRLLPSLQNQSEDCLYLNIYTPVSVGREAIRLPVLMFIHGESFQWNSGSSYDGSVLSSFGNMAVVTINFRLGVLGFFPVLDGNSRGNFGLMDQVAALHWIQENIQEFGGDPSNVAIMGHGFGAASVNLLMLSPMAKGLFHKAIMADGSALSPWAMAYDPLTYSRRLAARVGCPDEPDQNSVMVECLRQKSAQDLVNTESPSPKHLTNMGPTVDGIVLPSDPLSLMDTYSSVFGNYDLLLGISKVPYYDFSALDERQGIESGRRERILRTLVRNLYSYHLQEIHLTIANEYTDWSRSLSSLKSNDVFESLIEVLSDATMTAPLIRTALRHSHFKKRTFLYEFAYGTERGDYPANLGCVHGDDLSYLFGAPLVPGMQLSAFNNNFNKHETALSELLISYISNFVRSGNPNFDFSKDGSGKESSAGSTNRMSEKTVWPLFDEKQQQYLTLTMKPKVGHHYRGHRLSYWNNLIPKLQAVGVPSSGSAENHLDHEDVNSYEGVTRDLSISRTRTLMDSTSSSFAPVNSSSTFSAVRSAGVSDKSSSLTKITSLSPTTVKSVISDQRHGVKSASDVNNNHSYQMTPSKSMNASVSAMFQEGSYSAALSIAIAAGAFLLVLNILVFVCMLSHRDRAGNAVGQAGHDTRHDSCHNWQRKDHSRPSCPGPEHQQQHLCHRQDKVTEQGKSHGIQGDHSVNQFKGNHNHLYPGDLIPDSSLDVPAERMTPSPVRSSSPPGFTDFSAHVSMLHSNSFYSGTRAIPGLDPCSDSSLDPKLLTVHGIPGYSYQHTHDSQDMAM